MLKKYLKDAVVANVSLPTLPHIGEQSDETDDEEDEYKRFKTTWKEHGVDEVNKASDSESEDDPPWVGEKALEMYQWKELRKRKLNDKLRMSSH